MRRILAGIAASAVAVALALPAAAAPKKSGKPVQAQTSTCSKCSKKGAGKAKTAKTDCKKVNCDKTKNGKPCPKDCPDRTK